MYVLLIAVWPNQVRQIYADHYIVWINIEQFFEQNSITSVFDKHRLGR